MKISWSFALLLTLSTSAWCQTMYIDDTMYAPLRSGEGTEYRIVHKGLKSGTAVEVVRHNTTSGYSLVRAENTEGWIPTRFLIGEPIARDRLVKVTAELERLKAQLGETRSALAEGSTQSRSLTTERDRLLADNARLTQELEQIREISANALTLDGRNRELQETNQKLLNDIELLNADVQRLKDRRDHDFMLMGGGLVLAGVFITLIIPALKRNKRSDSWA